MAVVVVACCFCFCLIIFKKGRLVLVIGMLRLMEDCTWTVQVVLIHLDDVDSLNFDSVWVVD